MSFSAIIIDDEPLAVEALRVMAERLGMASIVGAASDAQAGLDLMARLAPQVAFVDISMPGMSGLELARRLRDSADPPLVVLVTAHDHFGTEAFDCAVVDYVLKPLKLERLARACERAQLLLAQRPPPSAPSASAPSTPAAPRAAEDFWVPHRGTIVRVAIGDVLCFQAERDYVRLHVQGASYLMRSALGAIESRIDAQCFMRVHRSTILRLDRIRALRHHRAGRWVAIDSDDQAWRIGRSFLASLRARLRLIDAAPVAA